MKYVCLVYIEEAKWHDVPDRECIACGEALRKAGKMIDGAPLHAVSTATTVRVREGRVSITDGPFAETKEQLAGFYMIDATDLDDALRIAAGIPPARTGSIEVRPVRDLEGRQ
jgi:hypothetical protein